MNSALANILFPGCRRGVLGLLLLHPENSYHVREIARLTATTPGTLARELSKLVEAGLLTRSPQGSQVLYAANTPRCLRNWPPSCARLRAGRGAGAGACAAGGAGPRSFRVRLQRQRQDPPRQ